tara:strand:- start:44 stop:259 length:216 start_codon:yes stop_codon:yes gene_type:complete
MFDPLYGESVTHTADLMVYIIRHFFIELVFPLFIFVAVMLTLFVDWSWIPLSGIDLDRVSRLEEVKKHLLE